jgi:hypothetical protein
VDAADLVPFGTGLVYAFGQSCYNDGTSYSIGYRGLQ